MSFLKKLFGLGGGSPAADVPAPAPTQEYKGFTIRATPVAEGREWRVAGVIAQEVDGVTKEQAFQRADRMGSRDECIEVVFQKGRQIIDDNRGRVFG